MPCRGGRCYIRWTGYELAVFRYSNTLAFPYELMFDFTDAVMSSRTTFSSFSQGKTNSYQRAGLHRFCDPHTFLKAWFAWASCQKYDFIMPDSQCGYSPNYLAGDGTKIGISFSLSKISPVEKRKGEEVSTPNRRHDRSFIITRRVSKKDQAQVAKEAANARLYLADLTDGFLKNGQSQSVDESKLTNLVEHLPPETRSLFTAFATRKLPSLKLIGLTGTLLKLLSCNQDSSVSVFLPFDCVPFVEAFVESPSKELATKVGYYNPYLSDFLSECLNCYQDGLEACVQDFLSYLCRRVRGIMSAVVEPGPASPIAGSYNPPKLGRFYYFREDGKQVRIGRKFSVDDNSKNTNYDDRPSGTPCRKYYPKVGARGSTFIFFWLCPLHDHCYGGHIVSGSEGRKDPHFSLYAHMEKAPKIVFYDFACSLHEYSSNRESGFFKHTRFYHDIFHGYSHVCSSCFKAHRLKGLEAFNTSICEQFNSFLQCVKSSARQMSQTNFMFFMQYFVHQWNLKKAKKFQTQVRACLRAVRKRS